MATKNEQPAPKAVKAPSLDVFKPDTITITIDYDDHQSYQLEYRALSWARWEAIAGEVPRPTPPLLRIDEQKRPVLNYQDAEYLRAMGVYGEQVALRRLLEMLEPGQEIPGASIEAKTAYLQSLDKGFLQQMIGAMSEVALGGRARLEARAKAFQSE